MVSRRAFQRSSLDTRSSQFNVCKWRDLDLGSTNSLCLHFDFNEFEPHFYFSGDSAVSHVGSKEKTNSDFSHIRESVTDKTKLTDRKSTRQ